MRLAHHLHQHPLGVFYFRLIVPADLQPAVGRKVIKKSLHTRDPATAKVWVKQFGSKACFETAVQELQAALYQASG